MIKTSIVADSVHLSLVRSLFNEAKKYDDVIDFTLGDPDVQTHQAIKDAACQAIQEGKTRYSQNAGLLDLRQTISRYYERKEGFKYDPMTEVMVTVGAMEGLYLALISMLNPGDEVIIPAPYYVNYTQMVRMCHAVPVIIDNPERTDLSFDVADIEKAITPKTRAIMINTPSNPSGRIIPQEKILGIAELAKKHDLVVISDEVYKCLIYDNQPFRSIVAIEGMRERTVIVDGFSKAFAMTGWRLGFLAAPKPITEQMLKLHQYAIMSSPTVSQYAAITALRQCSADIVKMRDEYNMRRRYLVDAFNRMGLECFTPKGAFYVFPSIKSTGLTSEEFCEKLILEKRVAVVPGNAFGDCGEGYIRVSYAYSIAHLKEAIKRIGEFLEERK